MKYTPPICRIFCHQHRRAKARLHLGDLWWAWVFFPGLRFWVKNPVLTSLTCRKINLLKLYKVVKLMNCPDWAFLKFLATKLITGVAQKKILRKKLLFLLLELVLKNSGYFYSIIWPHWINDLITQEFYFNKKTSPKYATLNFTTILEDVKC